MSQKNLQIDTCPGCKKAWLTHHTFDKFLADGRPSFRCLSEPVTVTDPVAAFLVGLRTESLKAKAEALELKLSRDADIQAAKTDAEDRFNAKVKTEVAKLVSAEVAKAEQTLVQKHAEFEAKILDQKQLLEEVRGDNLTLREEKTVIAGKLAESERKLADRQTELDELKERYVAFEIEVKDVLDGCDMLAVKLVSLNDRLKASGKKAVAVPAPIVLPTVPPPAPKAVAVAEPVTVPVTALVPPTPVGTSVWGDPESEPSASADDEDDESVNDGDVIELRRVGSDEGDIVSSEEDQAPAFDEDGPSDVEVPMAASDEDDDVSTEEDEVERCCQPACGKVSTHGFRYKTRSGEMEFLSTCNPKKHAEEFLDYLQANAVTDPDGALKSIPQKAGQLVKLFKLYPLTAANPNQTKEDQDA